MLFGNKENLIIYLCLRATNGVRVRVFANVCVPLVDHITVCIPQGNGSVLLQSGFSVNRLATGLCDGDLFEPLYCVIES